MTDNLIYSADANSFLAPYASIPEKSRGRLVSEPTSVGRSCYQRDRDRIIHSTAFRRLEYKTQVFVYHEGDHFRTRLTHSLEVAQLAKSIARELKLDEDLSEAISIAHDLGHTPFGHAGEDALNEAMHGYGGFDHNAQTIRVITKLESRYADFEGLNLTWECLEGIAKHSGPLMGDMPRALNDYVQNHDLELHSYPSLEAQVSGLCDDIAYNNHDIEDGMRAGLFALQDVLEVPFVGEAFNTVKQAVGEVDETVLVHEVKRKMISMMVADVVKTTQENILEADIRNIDDVRGLGRPLVCFSAEMAENIRSVSEFLMQHMYRHYKVNRMTKKAQRVVDELFHYFFASPNCLPTNWQQQMERKPDIEKAEIVADYIAGMTDKFALEEFQRIFDTSHRVFGE